MGLTEFFGTIFALVIGVYCYGIAVALVEDIRRRIEDARDRNRFLMRGRR